MKPEPKRELMPSLRFPEFQDAPEWEEKQLENVSIFVNGGMPESIVTLAEYVMHQKTNLPDYEIVKSATKLPPTGSVTQLKTNDVLHRILVLTKDKFDAFGQGGMVHLMM